jgi:hypothetical protein
MHTTDPIHVELVEFITNFHPSPTAQQRVAFLNERENESPLTQEEASELRDLMELEHLIRLAKVKAQAILADRASSARAASE